MIMIHFKANTEKIINSLLYLIQKANELGTKPSQYELVKSIFLADKAHLNKYGRPITFDNYVAMTHGPVPSLAYDLLKPTFNWQQMNRSGSPWGSEAEENKHIFSITSTPPDQSKLSKTDIKDLESSLQTILSLSFKQVRKLTHGDPAYIAAWRDEEDRQSFQMDMRLFFDSYDEDSIEDLQYLSEMTNA